VPQLPPKDPPPDPANQYLQKIEFGGLIWEKSRRSDTNEYTAHHPDIGDLRIFQYPKESSCDGEWLWNADIDILFSRDDAPKYIETRVSNIVETAEEAMAHCLRAREYLIEDIKKLSMHFKVGGYPSGFEDGQAALAKKIAAVMP
jgi:hypothetical protein